MGGNSNIEELMEIAMVAQPDVRDRLFATLYDELRSLARSHRRRWHGNQTLNTTALIHEVYIKFASAEGASFTTRGHFLATASRAMRQVLVNYAECMHAEKRGGGTRTVTLSGDLPALIDSIDDILAIEQLLAELESNEPRHARLVECRVFGDMTITETAAALDVSPATVKRDWSLVSAWLYREIHRGAPA